MNLRDLQEQAFHDSKNSGYTRRPFVLGEQIALVHAELSEIIEHDRSYEPDTMCDKCSGIGCGKCNDTGTALTGSRIGEEIVDAMLLLMYIGSMLDLDLQSQIERKMAYNRTRSPLHGKKY